MAPSPLAVARPCLGSGKTLPCQLVQDMQVCLAALEVMLQKRAKRGNMLEQAQHRTQQALAAHTQRGARATEASGRDRPTTAVDTRLLGQPRS